MRAITDDMGIPRSIYSIANSCRFVTTAIINLFFGKLILKFGPRKLAAMGFCEDYLRLPLTPMEDGNRAVLFEEMRKLGLDV